MLNKSKINNYIVLVKFTKYSIKNKIKRFRRKFIKKKRKKFFFNFKKYFTFNDNFNILPYFFLKLKRKKHWWKRSKFFRTFREQPKYHFFHIFKKYWSYTKKRPILNLKNKFILYIKYFYTYKSYRYIN